MKCIGKQKLYYITNIRSDKKMSSKPAPSGQNPNFATAYGNVSSCILIFCFIFVYIDKCGHVNGSKCNFCKLRWVKILYEYLVLQCYLFNDFANIWQMLRFKYFDETSMFIFFMWIYIQVCFSYESIYTYNIFVFNVSLISTQYCILLCLTYPIY